MRPPAHGVRSARRLTRAGSVPVPVLGQGAGSVPVLGPALRLTLGLGVLALVGFAACHGGPAPDTVATLGDHEIPYSAFTAYVEAQTDTSPASLESPVLSSLLDQFLDERILVRTAIDQGLIPEDAAGGGPEEKVDHRQALKALLQQAPKGEPTEDELRARYKAEKTRFSLPARVRLSQILVDDRATAEKAKAELDAGADFAEVAKRYSIDPSAPYGGSQGELSHDDLPEEFAAIIFRLQPGQVSDIVEADYGFHIFLVTERLPARTVPFEEAAPELRKRLREERAADSVSRLVTDARNRYTVRVYEDHLPFDYRGSYPTASSSDGPAGS